MTTRQWDVLQPTRDVAERLATEFDGVVAPERVASIVLEAAGDLTGQVQTEAFNCCTGSPTTGCRSPSSSTR